MVFPWVHFFTCRSSVGAKEGQLAMMSGLTPLEVRLYVFRRPFFNNNDMVLLSRMSCTRKISQIFLHRTSNGAHMLAIPSVSTLTTAAAIITPSRISGNALRKGIPKTNAIRVAVHAPVKGKGTATNNTKAKSLNISNDLSCFFLVCRKSREKNLSKKEKRRESAPLTMPKKGKSNTGTILPATERENACNKDSLYTNKAKGIAPLNS